MGAGASLFAVDGTGVGIGTTSSGFKLSVVGLSTFVGNVEVVGVVTATSFKGDGSALN